jgi:NAD(P)H-hydrate epimerase
MTTRDDSAMTSRTQTVSKLGHPHDVATCFDTQAAQAADTRTIEVLGVPSEVLMERAALACSAELEARIPGGGRVIVLCGPGNNGADGVAIARQLSHRGQDVSIVLATETGNASRAQQLRLAQAWGVPVLDTLPQPDAVDPTCTWIVDALLGTGAHGTPREDIAAALAWLARCDAPVLAVDVPTGIDADTGRATEHAVRARVTVTFVATKPGLHVTPGRGHAGEVVVADIGIVPDASAPSCDVRLVDPRRIGRRIAGLRPARHKGERGHVGFVAGGRSTPGALVLAATSALRGGAGVATVRTEPEVGRLLVGLRPEVMFDEGPDILPRCDALVIGPGLTDAAGQAEATRLWGSDSRPSIWDASALGAIPSDVPRGGPRVVTPHPGEAVKLLARLAGPEWTSTRVNEERLLAARTLAQRLDAVVVLKGEGTLVASPTGAVSVVTEGGPELATAGTGDVLAGAIGAFLARGFSLVDAAEGGVLVHALAGALARRDRPGVLALDVAEALPLALEKLVTAPYAACEHWPRWVGF